MEPKILHSPGLRQNSHFIFVQRQHLYSESPEVQSGHSWSQRGMTETALRMLNGLTKLRQEAGETGNLLVTLLPRTSYFLRHWGPWMQKEISDILVQDLCRVLTSDIRFWRLRPPEDNQLSTLPTGKLLEI